jgi:5-methylcytosine-specific restriction endonuclease McrBC regulatory subunit McrC
MTNLKPDLVISDQFKNVITVLDTKWKNSGGFKPSMEDLRQMLAYNYYQECDHSALVYPSSTSEPFYIQGQYQKDNKSCSLLLLPLIKVKNTMQLDLTYIEKHINQCILKNTES